MEEHLAAVYHCNNYNSSSYCMSNTWHQPISVVLLLFVTIEVVSINYAWVLSTTKIASHSYGFAGCDVCP